MTPFSIPQLRLRNQRIIHSTFQSPVEVVRWLGAVQSQDYLAAKWAVGQRAQGVTDAAVERAFDEGAILRTHVLRPTWHFVTPADIRWMLALTAPRVKAASAYYYRRLGLGLPASSRTNTVIEKALRDGNALTRAELTARLEQAGILSSTDDPLRSTYLIFNAELDGIICSGPRRGKQHTYTLLDERAPGVPRLERDAALAELARRYFTSRGPATLKDFSWWSGLSAEDARAGLAMVRTQLVEKVIDGQSYWLDPSLSPDDQENVPAVHLLPNYDEYIVSYADRSAIYNSDQVQQVDSRGNFLFNHTIVVDGQVVGVWKRTFKKSAVEITPNLFIPLSDAETRALAAAMDRYSQFLNMPRLENH